MNSHTPKWAPTLGIGVPMDSQILRQQLQRSKPNGLRSSLYHWKALGTKMSKMGLHDPFGHLKHKLWPKEGSGVILTIWLPTTKSHESPQFPCFQVACDIPLKSSWRGLQFCFRPHFNQRSTHELWAPKVAKVPILGISGFPLGSHGRKWHLDVGPVARHRVYYKKGRWWLPPSLDHSEYCESMFASGSFVHQSVLITH
jgi:hypothetical protein